MKKEPMHLTDAERKKPKKVLSVYLDAELLDKVRTHAYFTTGGISFWVARAISQAMDDEGGNT